MALEIDDINVSGNVAVTGTVSGSNIDSGSSVTGTNTGDQIISDATISLTDITTNDASTSKHGFLRKLSNNANEFLTGIGTWATATTVWGNITGTLASQTDLQNALDAKQSTSGKDASSGYVGLTGFSINFKNVANTFTSFLTNTNSASRTYTFPNKDITVAGLVDITGTNSGTNTGDETGARIATLLHASSNKTSLVDADEVNGTDSANSFSLIRTTWTNVKVFLKTYFDGIYITQNTPITPGTSTKVTYDADGLITSGTTLVAGDIPTIAQSQVTNLVSDLAAKEVLANKSTTTTLGTSDTLYPTQNAVKTYVDNFLDIDVQSAFSTPSSGTNSPTGADLPGATLTTTGTKTKEYIIIFNGELQQSSAADTTNSIRFLINGVVQTNYLASVFLTNATQPTSIGRSMVATVPPGQIIKVQFYTTAGTVTMNRGSLSIQGIA